MSIIKNQFANDKRDNSNNFDNHYQEYYNKILKHVTYLTGNPHTAEDIAQETFIRYYNSPPEHQNVIAWLTKVATNLAYNHVRDENTRKNKEPDIYEHDANKVISIEEVVIKDSEVRLIRKILNSMDVRDRTCLLLKFSGYKYDEIAEIIGVEKTSVGTILVRCQAKFKERYKKEVQS